jgi:hypothetical protein
MPKRGQLVCANLEYLPRETLEEYQAIIRGYVRGRQGIYALYRKGKLYYVGLASNLRARLKHHLYDRHSGAWDRFSVYLTIGDHHLREMESLLLRIAKPKGNKVKGKFARSEDLKKKLRREIRKHHRAIEAAIFCGDIKLTEESSQQRKRQVEKKPSSWANYAKQVTKLTATFKGKTVRARVLRDGMIRFQGQIYTSPSLAGAAAVGRPTCNGWTFWKYERAPGDWVAIDELRK